MSQSYQIIKSAINFVDATAHAPQDEETIVLTRFPSGDKLHAFIRSFYGLKGPVFFFRIYKTNI